MSHAGVPKRAWFFIASLPVGHSWRPRSMGQSFSYEKNPPSSRTKRRQLERRETGRGRYDEKLLCRMQLPLQVYVYPLQVVFAAVNVVAAVLQRGDSDRRRAVRR